MSAPEVARRAAADRTGPGRSRSTRVINATGVVLHTNLGRALLSPLAQERVLEAAGAYTNLEIDVVAQGARVALQPRAGPLRRLTGAEAALVVNNCAAAVLLALETLARGSEVDRLAGRADRDRRRVPHPRHHAPLGRVLREVGRPTARTSGTTRAPSARTRRSILKVHPSNYRVVGFTAEVGSNELADMAHARGIR